MNPVLHVGAHVSNATDITYRLMLGHAAGGHCQIKLGEVMGVTIYLATAADAQRLLDATHAVHAALTEHERRHADATTERQP